jgi:hypothetical protein
MRESSEAEPVNIALGRGRGPPEVCETELTRRKQATTMQTTMKRVGSSPTDGGSSHAVPRAPSGEPPAEACARAVSRSCSSRRGAGIE